VTAADQRSARTEDAKLRQGSAVMAVAGLGFVGYAGIFFARNFTDSFLELGIGPNEVDASRDEIQAFSPSLLHYISHLHIALAGFIAAAGLAIAALAWFGVRRGQLWAWTAAVAIPAVGLAISLPAHYPNDLDTLGHLGLAYANAALFTAGAVMTYGPIAAARTSSARTVRPTGATTTHQATP